VRTGARRQQTVDDDFNPGRSSLDDWSERRFQQLDHDGDHRLTRKEWHYDLEDFLRADRNRDGVVSRDEFLDASFDDDRGDRFEYLDLDGNQRIEFDEWHGSREAFNWLDRNGDGVLTRTEVTSDEIALGDRFASLDLDANRAVSLAEWHWSRASFNLLDRNRDGQLSRAEFDAAGPLNEAGATGTPVSVPATDRWTDTGIYLRAGDVVTFAASGSITMTGANDPADPRGSRTGRRAANAPLPEEPAGLLIARIGTWEAIPVGASKTLTAPRDGRLYLGVNDDHLNDNRGGFTVTITVRRQGN
jgi:Ca2+-binding EF-hand superfamily protein